MSTLRPDWFPVYGDPVRCPISGAPCLRFNCVDGSYPGYVRAATHCEARNELALVPMDEPPSQGRES